MSRPLSILALSDFYPPVIGGLERHVSGISRELARRGHRVAVATLSRGTNGALEVQHGVRVHRLSGWTQTVTPAYQDTARPFHPTAPDPGVMAGLRRVIAEERPDIVQAHSWILHSMLPLKRWSGAKLVVYLHDYGLVCAKKTLLRNGGTCPGPAYRRCVGCASSHYGPAKGITLTTGLWASSRLYGQVDRFVANSSAVAEASRQAPGPREARIDVVPSFVPEEAPWTRDPEPPSFLPDGEFLLFVGALTRHKGLDVLLKAYEDLEPKLPLVLIGTRNADTPTSFPPGVTVAYDVSHPQVMAAWARCAVGVVPSVWPEPFGQVAIEAMSSSRPVVASSVGGLRDLVADERTGLLVPPGDATRLREALARLLADPGLREQMGSAGRRRALRYTLANTANRMEEIYASVLGEAA
jgi:glycosyltransferase involved in cell wall biosynthesis